MKQPIILEICCGLLVLLFLYAGFSKLIPPSELNRFKLEMYGQPFSHRLADIFIWLIPAMEISTAISLIIGKYRKIGLWASFILMTAFTLYTFAILIHLFPRTPCSCGGVIEQLSWPQHFAFNTAFTGIAVIGLIFHNKIKKRVIIATLI